MSKRYKVTVLVDYHVSADSVDDARNIVEQGAEFPVMPFDDETYCDTVTIQDVLQLSE